MEGSRGNLFNRDRCILVYHGHARLVLMGRHIYTYKGLE